MRAPPHPGLPALPEMPALLLDAPVRTTAVQVEIDATFAAGEMQTLRARPDDGRLLEGLRLEALCAGLALSGPPAHTAVFDVVVRDPKTDALMCLPDRALDDGPRLHLLRLIWTMSTHDTALGLFAAVRTLIPGDDLASGLPRHFLTRSVDVVHCKMFWHALHLKSVTIPDSVLPGRMRAHLAKVADSLALRAQAGTFIPAPARSAHAALTRADDIARAAHLMHARLDDSGGAAVAAIRPEMVQVPS